MIATGRDITIAKLDDAVDRQLPLAERLFRELAQKTQDGAGVTRASYGGGEQIAHDLIRGVAGSLGLETAIDNAGNLYITLPGADRRAPRWISGSHLDSVPKGGNYDGAAGVIAALISLAAIKDLSIVPPQDLCATAIRAEECSSWFKGEHGGHLGSRAALGLLKSNEFDAAIHLATARSLAQSIDDAGGDATALRSGPPSLTKDTVRGFVELHIEQGPLLIDQDRSVAIVSAIRGNLRLRNAVCRGVYAHSGAVPQNLRQDAVLATAEFIHTIEAECDRIRARGGDVVFAVGRLHTDAAQDSLTKVPGETRFTLDIRSQSLPILQDLDRTLHRHAEAIAATRKVTFDLGPGSLAEPATMDANVRERLADGAARLGIAAPDMACGSGHDAAEFVRAGIPASMILIRNSGESHSPDEHMELADFREGVRLLAWFLATAQ